MATPRTSQAASAPAVTLHPENLHIELSQLIVCKHHHQPRIPLDRVKRILERAAKDAGKRVESKDNALMREHLERATGLSIAQLAELSKRWPVCRYDD